jgi:hypothetical protein
MESHIADQYLPAVRCNRHEASMLALLICASHRRALIRDVYSLSWRRLSQQILLYTYTNELSLFKAWPGQWGARSQQKLCFGLWLGLV